MIIYGISNCDTMQKAFKFLETHKIKYTFHNYKTEGLNKETLLPWFEAFPITTIINTKSTTYKNLTEAQKTNIANKTAAIAIVLENPSIVKRPLIDLENGKFLIGFKEEEWNLLLKKKAKK